MKRAKTLKELEELVSSLNLQEEQAKETLKLVRAAFRLGQDNPHLADVKNPWGTDTFRDAWIMWVAFRKEKGAPIKGQISASRQLKKIIRLSNGSEEMAIAIIEQSMDNNWTGLFALSKENKKGLSDGIPYEPDMDWLNRQEDPKLVTAAKQKWRGLGYLPSTRQTGAGSVTTWKK